MLQGLERSSYARIGARDRVRARIATLHALACPLLVVGVLACVALPRSALAQNAARSFGRTDPLMPIRIDGHIASAWDGHLGVGARIDIPIATSAALRYSNRDEVSVSLGADVTFIELSGSTELRAYPTVAFQWSLGVTDRVYFFPEFGLSARVDRDGYAGLAPNLGFGARFYLQRSFGLFARLGWPMALSSGANF